MQRRNIALRILTASYGAFILQEDLYVHITSHDIEGHFGCCDGGNGGFNAAGPGLCGRRELLH